MKSLRSFDSAKAKRPTEADLFTAANYKSDSVAALNQVAGSPTLIPAMILDSIGEDFRSHQSLYRG